MQPSYPKTIGRRLLTVSAAAALGVGAFALPAAAQAPVPVNVGYYIPVLPANNIAQTGDFSIEFGEDFTPGEHTVEVLVQFDEPNVYPTPSDSEDGTCGPRTVHSPEGDYVELVCTAAEADAEVYFEYLLAADVGAWPGEYAFDLQVEVDGEQVAA